MILLKIKGFLKSCLDYGFRYTIKNAIRLRIEKVKNIFFKDALYYPSWQYHDSSTVQGLNHTLNYVEDYKTQEKFRFDDYWKWRERRGM